MKWKSLSDNMTLLLQASWCFYSDLYQALCPQWHCLPLGHGSLIGNNWLIRFCKLWNKKNPPWNLNYCWPCGFKLALKTILGPHASPCSMWQFLRISWKWGEMYEKRYHQLGIWTVWLKMETQGKLYTFFLKVLNLALIFLIMCIK